MRRYWDLVSSLTVELHPSDVAFWSDGCGWWTQVLTPPSGVSDAPFGPGTWLVGGDRARIVAELRFLAGMLVGAGSAALDGGPSAIAASGVDGRQHSASSRLAAAMSPSTPGVAAPGLA